MHLINPEYHIANMLVQHMILERKFTGLYIQENTPNPIPIVSTSKDQFNQIIHIPLNEYIKIARKPIATFEKVINNKIEISDITIIKKLGLVTTELWTTPFYKPVLEVEIKNIIYALTLSQNILDDPQPIINLINEYNNDLKTVTDQKLWRYTTSHPRIIKALKIFIKEITKKYNIEYKTYVDISI